MNENRRLGTNVRYFTVMTIWKHFNWSWWKWR